MRLPTDFREIYIAHSCTRKLKIQLINSNESFYLHHASKSFIISYEIEWLGGISTLYTQEFARNIKVVYLKGMCAETRLKTCCEETSCPTAGTEVRLTRATDIPNYDTPR